MYRKRRLEDIKSEINTVEKEAEVKEEELEKINNKLNYLYSELRYNIQEEKTKNIEVEVTYGGKLPISPERDSE